MQVFDHFQLINILLAEIPRNTVRIIYHYRKQGYFWQETQDTGELKSCQSLKIHMLIGSSVVFTEEKQNKKTNKQDRALCRILLSENSMYSDVNLLKRVTAGRSASVFSICDKDLFQL